jgi:glutaredoxin-related protein
MGKTRKLFFVILCLGTFFVEYSNKNLIEFVTSQASTKLGNLSKFKSIALEVNTLVEKNKLADAKNKIKDLEAKWDEAEAGIKPLAGKDWRLLDKKIDLALQALRDDRPSFENCKKTINDLIETFNYLEK